MLKRHRCIVIWSLSIGVAMAGIATGWTRLHTESVDALVAKRLAACKAASTGSSTGIPVTPEEWKRSYMEKKSAGGHWVPDVPLQESPECNPDSVRAVFTKEIEESNAAADWRGLGIIAIFGVPLVWYFLLDRLREISDALFHRDQH